MLGASRRNRRNWATVTSLLAIANVPRALFNRRYGQAFVSSSLTIASLVFLLAMALFPNVVPASNDPALSLTIYNASSSPKTLRLGLWFVGIGLPFVLGYTGLVYWTFRGKVELGDSSY